MSEADEVVIWLFIFFESLLLCLGCLGVFKGDDISKQDSNYECIEGECNNE